jgi:hypothetical protein
VRKRAGVFQTADEAIDDLLGVTGESRLMYSAMAAN